MPTIDIWVHRVKEGNEYSIKNWIESKNIEVHNIIKKSNLNSKYLSFKVNVDKRDLHDLLNDKFWPKGAKAKVWRNKYTNVTKTRSYTNNKYRDNI